MDIICSKDSFKNPDKQPLNKVFVEYKKAIRISKNAETLENILEMLLQSTDMHRYNECYKNDVIKTPALDKCWIEKKSYHKFIPYLFHINESDNKDFLHNESFLQQLKFLVDCSYQQFWCYIAYDQNVIVMIKDFLQNSVPVHIVTHLSKKYFDLYNQMHSCILSILHRLMDFNLSEIEYLEEDTVREIFRDSNLFDIATVFSACYLYNLSDHNVIKQIINFCLSAINDDSFVKGINRILSKIGSELEHFINSTTKCSSKALEETTFFLFEMASGLNHFLSVCDDAVKIAFSMDLPFGIMCVYQKVYSEIDDTMGKRGNGEDCIKHIDLVKRWVAYGKFEFINTVHIFTTHCINAIISFRNNSVKQANAIEIYISLISNALDNDLFIISYNETYPVRDQFQILVDCVSNFDSQQTDYLLESLDSIINQVHSVQDDPVPSTLPTYSKELGNEQNYVEQCEKMYVTLSQFLERFHNKKGTTLPKSVSLVLEQYYDLLKQLHITDVQSTNGMSNHNVQAVLDILPHLSSNFVTKCLQKYNGDPNKVIAHVLNGDLPADLADLSHPAALDEASTSKYPMEQQIGKKWNDLNTNSVLDDKKEKEKIKELVLKASYTFDLDDEYDDRVEIGHSLNDSDNESRILRHLGEAEEESEESEYEEETVEGKRNNSRDFCVDPAVLREKRAQQHHNTKVFRQNKSGEQNNEKTFSKSTKSNHNRRKGATWKRNKGMIPS